MICWYQTKYFVRKGKGEECCGENMYEEDDYI